MRAAEQKKAAGAFAKYWKGKGYEKGESQRFWLELLGQVYGVSNPSHVITFEEQVRLDHTSFIDGFIPSTHVLIEQKGIGKDLQKPIRQSDGTLLTPFQQAKRYAAELPYSMRPRWIVVCNFEKFHVYDMERPGGEPEEILLANLETDYYRLNFLTDTGDDTIKKEMEVSLKAGEVVGKLYDAILKQYREPDSPEALKSLNMLCVRLVFCLYAEDAGIFGGHGKFYQYLKRAAEENIKNVREALIKLFLVLDTKPEDRDPYMDEELASFPYVNGGLFAEEKIEIPRFNEEIVTLLLEKASADFDWSEISPTIFGAVFESTLNPATRRSGGMHYTSIENIHKVIDPLFLDELKEELAKIKEIAVDRTRERKLRAFQEKLSSLTFLDPACGSGNFLTETYLSLRRLENEVLKELTAAAKGQIEGQISFGDLGGRIGSSSLDENRSIGTDTVLAGQNQTDGSIKVSIGQFYGIEINDFAVTVAKTALWIAESQMMKETENIVHMPLDFLPLKSYANIVEGNALRLDWERVVSKDRLSFIMGNPPFVGYSLQSREQKADILSVYTDESGKPYQTAGKIDYVSGWYFKASQLMKGTGIRTAFVSTNSITQGEQVAGVWKPLYERFGIHIDFAHRTFIWDSEASLKAHVHCVIVGFSAVQDNRTKRLYLAERKQEVKKINAYLLDAPVIFIESRKKPISDVPEMTTGNRPADGGHLIIEAADYKEFIRREPEAKKYIKRLMGAAEFINNKQRYCLWLVGVSPSELKRLPLVMQRIKRCKEDRENAPDIGRRKLAERPSLFRETKNPDSCIVVAEVSSQNRRYVPMDFIGADIICTNKLQMIPGAEIYHFGILMSNVHMAWMRAVCGRLKSDYDYSIKIVYNNFPWPSPTGEQKAKIEQTARAILDARALYPDASLADLYDELLMPPELRRAHQENDRAVMRAYGFDIKTTTESVCVAELMKLYREKTKTEKE